MTPQKKNGNEHDNYLTTKKAQKMISETQNQKLIDDLITIEIKLLNLIEAIAKLRRSLENE